MALSSPEILDLEDDDLLLQADDYPSSDSPHKCTLSIPVNQDPDTGIASANNILPNAVLATATNGGQGITGAQASGPARGHTPSSPPQALHWYWLKLLWPGLVPSLQPVSAGMKTWKLLQPTKLFQGIAQCCNVFATGSRASTSRTSTLSTIYFKAVTVQPQNDLVHSVFPHFW